MCNYKVTFAKIKVFSKDFVYLSDKKCIELSTHKDNGIAQYFLDP